MRWILKRRPPLTGFGPCHLPAEQGRRLLVQDFPALLLGDPVPDCLCESGMACKTIVSAAKAHLVPIVKRSPGNPKLLQGAVRAQLGLFHQADDFHSLRLTEPHPSPPPDSVSFKPFLSTRLSRVSSATISFNWWFSSFRGLTLGLVRFADGIDKQALLAGFHEVLGPFVVQRWSNAFHPVNLRDRVLDAHHFQDNAGLLLGGEFPACLPFDIRDYMNGGNFFFCVITADFLNSLRSFGRSPQAAKHSHSLGA